MAATVWTFLSNHAHVLICVARDPQLTIRELSDVVGITERAVQRILGELSSEGYLQKEREGRNNRYVLDPDRPLRHPVEASHTVGTLIRAMGRRGSR